MKLTMHGLDVGLWQVYLNGHPVDAVSADEEAGLVELLVKDQNGMPILSEGEDLLTVRVSGRVQIRHRPMPDLLSCEITHAGNPTR